MSQSARGESKQRTERPAWLLEGIRGGLAIGVIVVVFGVLGLTPSLSWLPELPLLTLAIVVPMAGLGAVGYRVESRTHRGRDPALGAAIAGGLSGAVGGLTYVLFGKPLLNLAVGLVVGAMLGAVAGAVGGRLRARTVRL